MKARWWDRADERWQRPRPDAAQRRWDRYVGLALVAGTLLSVVLLNSMGAFVLGKPPPWPEQVAWSVALSVPLVWRRRWPEVVTVVTAAVFIGAQVRGNTDTLMASVTLFFALYTLGAWGRNRWLAARIRVCVIVAMFIWLGVSIVIALVKTPSGFPGAAGPLPPLAASLLYSVLFNLLFFLAAYFFGDIAWTSARRQHDLEVQAEELRQSRAAEAERAVTGERIRIARELHDVVAHHVSVMGVQAAASRRTMDRDPEQAKQALAAVEQTARTAVDELRRMLGVLRQAGGTSGPDGAGHTAASGLDQLGRLLDGARDAGLTVDYGVFGAEVPVPESVSLTAYRIVQEALTNTIKHARASIVDVRVRYLTREVEVEVTDDGRGAAGSPAAGSGLGLVGMRERVAAHDGVLEVGPRSSGGYRVRARFPLASPDAGPRALRSTA